MSPSSAWPSDTRRTSPSRSACSAAPSHRTRCPPPRPPWFPPESTGSVARPWRCGVPQDRPFGTVAHTPRQGQGAPLILDVEQQRQAATTDDTAIYDHHLRLYVKQYL